jgi:two-component system, chemotaxis family, response regulator Rcp1
MTVQVTAIEILLVEDSEADIVLTEEAIKDAKVMNRLSVVRDGEAAMRRTRREDPYEDETRPDLILLDLNLPLKDGRQVLRELKQDEDLRRIPVVVLTTSAAERDILAAYDLHVNAYITKPVDIEQFVAVVRAIEDFWLSVVRLPNGAG